MIDRLVTRDRRVRELPVLRLERAAASRRGTSPVRHNSARTTADRQKRAGIRAIWAPDSAKTKTETYKIPQVMEVSVLVLGGMAADCPGSMPDRWRWPGGGRQSI